MQKNAVGSSEVVWNFGKQNISTNAGANIIYTMPEYFCSAIFCKWVSQCHLFL